MIQYRLSVYPPGTDTRARRWVHAQELWSGAGIVWTTGVAFLLMRFVEPGLVAAAAAGVYLSGLAIIVRRARVTRRGTRHLVAVDFGDRSTPEETDRCAHLRESAATLSAADRSLAAGEISPVAHEVIWARVYDDVSPTARSGIPSR